MVGRVSLSPQLTKEGAGWAVLRTQVLKEVAGWALLSLQLRQMAETARLSPQQRPTVQSLNGAQTVSVSGMVWLATQNFFRINSLR